MLGHKFAMGLDPALFARSVGLEPDPWQADVLRSPAKRMLLLCCRQSGKSTTTALLALHTASYYPGSLVLLLSPSLRQSSELFRKVAGFYGALAEPVPADAETALRLELSNGSRVVSLPGTESTVRGYSGVDLLVVDEAARVEDSLYYAVRPMLAVSRGRMIALSTPWGKRGWYHKAWTEGGEAWQRVKVTAEECPRISAEFLAEERAAIGDWWYKQEYECEFVETDESLFTYEQVTGAVSSDVAPLFAIGDDYDDE